MLLPPPPLVPAPLLARALVPPALPGSPPPREEARSSPSSYSRRLRGAERTSLGVLDLLEALLGGVVAWVDVWMVLADHPAVGAAEVLLGRSFGLPEQLVQIFGRPQL